VSRDSWSAEAASSAGEGAAIPPSMSAVVAAKRQTDARRHPSRPRRAIQGPGIRRRRRPPLLITSSQTPPDTRRRQSVLNGCDSWCPVVLTDCRSLPRPAGHLPRMLAVAVTNTRGRPRSLLPARWRFVSARVTAISRTRSTGQSDRSRRPTCGFPGIPHLWPPGQADGGDRQHRPPVRPTHAARLLWTTAPTSAGGVLPGCTVRSLPSTPAGGVGSRRDDPHRTRHHRGAPTDDRTTRSCSTIVCRESLMNPGTPLPTSTRRTKGLSSRTWGGPARGDEQRIHYRWDLPPPTPTHERRRPRIRRQGSPSAETSVTTPSAARRCQPAPCSCPGLPVQAVLIARIRPPTDGRPAKRLDRILQECTS
jgi:hypothetical protein